MMRIPPKRICLTGGGIRVVACIGALEVLQEQNLLRNVKEYVGISAGAFISAAMCIGYTLSELKKICLEFDWGLIRHVDEESGFLFFESFGFDDGSRMILLLESILRQKKVSKDITFSELKERNPRGPLLRCYATDLYRCCIREFSVKETPTVRIVDALRASMGMTFYFTPVHDPVTGHLLTDGGIINNYPMAFLTEQEQNESMGFTFSGDHTRKETVSEITDYFQQIFASMYVSRNEPVNEKTAEQTILLPKGEFPSWNFEATREERLELMIAAAEATREFLKKGPKRPVPMRRYSVN